jgi:hypothetical protein
MSKGRWKRQPVAGPPDEYVIHHSDGTSKRGISVMLGGDAYRMQHAGEMTMEGSAYRVTLTDGTTFKRERLWEVRAELAGLGNKK